MHLQVHHGAALPQVQGDQVKIIAVCTVNVVANANYWCQYRNNNDKSSNRTRAIVCGVTIMTVIARVHPSPMMNAEHHQVAANPQTKSAHLGCPHVCCYCQ